MHLTFTYKILESDWPYQVIYIEQNPQIHVYSWRYVDSTLHMASSQFYIELI